MAVATGWAPEKWQGWWSPLPECCVSPCLGRFQQASDLDGAPLAGATAEDFLRRLLLEHSDSPVKLSPAVAHVAGFTQVSFGNAKGGTGFVQYRVRDGRIQLLGFAAAAAGEANWALPIAGAVAFTLNCGPATAPRDPALSMWTSVVGAMPGAVSARNSDFARSAPDKSQSWVMCMTPPAAPI